VVDDAAAAAYRARLGRLAVELDHADTVGDQAAAIRAEDERQAILAELSRAQGLAGRSRHTERPNRMRAECATEPGPGVLVYVENIVAGWCSICATGEVPAPAQLSDRPSPGRPRRVDRRLLRRPCWVPHARADASAGRCCAACDDNGAEVVEVYPVEAGGDRVDHISGYGGSVEPFERAGFERAAPTTRRSGGRPRWVMRKTLR
jgi:hypothetical protein